jgi:hypothetical protein
MRIRLKGLNSITKKLADGSTRTYYYAWKGGPPLRGEPGTPEFIHSYNEAIATKAATPQRALLSVLQAYQASGEFNGLANRTRCDYITHIKAIEKKFGDFPLSGLAPPVLNFWFEFASTYSYPAMMRITSLADAAGIALKFRPFLLGPVFKAQG